MRLQRFIHLAIATTLVLTLGGVSKADQFSSGLTGGAELLLLRMYGNQGAGGDSSVGNIDDYFPDYGLNATGRLWFGYEHCTGLGIRTRLFQWEESAPYLSNELTQDIEMYDLEGTIRSKIHEWQLLGFAGVRWGSIELAGADFGELNAMSFDGAGGTFGGEIRRALIGDISVLVAGRYSLLYGDTSFEPVPTTASLDNTMVDVTELKLGVEWTRESRFGGNFTLGVAWEHQLYGTDTYLPYAIDPETLGDVALSGPVFSIGWTR